MAAQSAEQSKKFQKQSVKSTSQVLGDFDGERRALMFFHFAER